MSTEDQYKTIEGESSGTFRDRGSKFIAFAGPAVSEAACEDYLENIRQLHPKARHHCYAYRLGPKGKRYRANDDGEPSGTAGRPILGQIDRFELTNVMLVVVRYFGGTLLGTSGLIQAYKGSAEAALSSARIIRKTVKDIYRIRFDSGLMGPMMNAVKERGLDIVSQDFSASPCLEVAIPKSEASETVRRLKAELGDLYPGEIEPDTSIDGLRFTYLRTR
ncbi:MAG: YigZ family protein [Saprospiraceae bacterium]|nr:YigZ family protein [Saprospiraceae bacterium]